MPWEVEEPVLQTLPLGVGPGEAAFAFLTGGVGSRAGGGAGLRSGDPDFGRTRRFHRVFPTSGFGGGGLREGVHAVGLLAGHLSAVKLDGLAAGGPLAGGASPSAALA